MISAKQLDRTGGPKRLARYLKRRQVEPMHADDHGHKISVRTADHNGYKIEIETTYVIRVDGNILEGHMGVGNDGSVHYHPIPNYSAASMVDLMRTVIDAFPEDFPTKRKRSRAKRKKRPRRKA